MWDSDTGCFPSLEQQLSYPHPVCVCAQCVCVCAQCVCAVCVQCVCSVSVQSHRAGNAAPGGSCPSQSLLLLPVAQLSRAELHSPTEHSPEPCRLGFALPWLHRQGHLVSPRSSVVSLVSPRSSAVSLVSIRSSAVSLVHTKALGGHTVPGDVDPSPHSGRQ